MPGIFLSYKDNIVLIIRLIAIQKYKLDILVLNWKKTLNHMAESLLFEFMPEPAYNIDWIKQSQAFPSFPWFQSLWHWSEVITTCRTLPGAV